MPLIDDDYFEKREHFYVHVESEKNVVIHGSPYIPVHIYDDDGINKLLLLYMSEIILFLYCSGVLVFYSKRDHSP